MSGGASSLEESVLWLFGTEPGALKRAGGMNCFLLDFLLRNWHVAALFENRIRQIAPGLLTGLNGEHFCRLAAAVRYLSEAQHREAARVSQALRQEAIRHLFLKGAPLQSLTDKLRGRAGHDLDFGIERTDLTRLWPVLLELGYEEIKRPQELGPFRAGRHHELAQLCRAVPLVAPDDGLLWIAEKRLLPLRRVSENLELVFHLDPHIDVSQDLTLKFMFDSESPSGNPELSLPSTRAVTCYAILKIYYEGIHTYAKGLHLYADLIALIEYFDDADWESVAKFFNDLNLRPTFVYVLRRVPSLTGRRLPDAAMAHLSSWSVPSNKETPSSINDFGDMWPKLWGRIG